MGSQAKEGDHVPDVRKTISIKDYQPTPEQLAAIAEHDRKRAELVAFTLKQWEEKKLVKKRK